MGASKTRLEPHHKYSSSSYRQKKRSSDFLGLGLGPEIERAAASEKEPEAMGNVGSSPNEAKKADSEDAEGRRPPPSTVRFFPSASQHKARQPPPIKLEEEDVPPPPATEEDMAPRNLWQVYALGAFIVLRWAWAKWKENKDRDDSPDGQSPDGSS